MDLRQIQVLHAQYSAQPVVIDIAGHTAAMPALPAPERKSGGGLRLTGLPAKLKKVGRLALIGVAIAAIAAGGGMSAAKLWRVLRDKPEAVHKSEQPATAMVKPPVASESAINVAPARPLTASDFGQQKAPALALASVDPRSLSDRTQRPVPADAKTSDGTTDAAHAHAHAAASSIHAQRPAIAVQPITAPALTLASVQPVAMAPSAPAQPTARTPTETPQSAAPVTSPATARAASAVEAHAAKPTLRSIRHIAAHHAMTPATDASPSAAAATQPAPARNPTPKGGDVQLF